MIQRKKVNVNQIRQICADYLQVVKDDKTRSDELSLLSCISFFRVMDEIYGKGSNKEILAIMHKKNEKEGRKIIVPK